MAIRLAKETQNQATDSIQRYFDLNVEESKGTLQAKCYWIFCSKIDSSIYNQAATRRARPNTTAKKN